MSQTASLQHLPNGNATIESQQSTYIPVVKAPIEPSEANLVLRLMNTNRKGGLNIEGIAYNVINPKTKEPDTLRLLVGVYTPWASEQKNITDEFLKKNRRSLKFQSNTCVVAYNDKAGKEFAQYCPSNIESPSYGQGNKHSFYVHDPKRQEEEQLKAAMEAMEQVQTAATVEESIMRKHANYLGVVFHDEFGLLKGEKAIRREYMLKAQQNPKLFKDTIDSPVVTVAYHIKKAISDAKIDLGRIPGTAYWASGGFICKVPNTKKAVDYLIEFAMLPTEEGKQFLAHLQADAQ